MSHIDQFSYQQLKVDNSDDADSRQSDEENGESSSELDEEESERRKSVLINDLTEIEKNFINLREQLYMARKERIERKLEEVKVGKAAEYLLPLEELQNQMRIRNQVAEIYKELRIKNIECQYDAENCATKQDFESERQSIINQIREDLDDKLCRLDEDRNSIDSNTFWSSMSTNPISSKVANGTRDHLFLPDRRRKPVSITGPYIIYMLRDEEISEDHANIYAK